MSRFAKSDAYNSLKDARTGSLGLPAGTTAERDPVPAAGEIRWNTSNSRLEFFNGSSWSEVSTRGNVTITKDSFTGDGTTTIYVLSITPTSANNILVFVGNVYQEPGVNFTLVGATLTFISAPPLATNIVVLHGFDSTGNTTPPPVGNNTIGVREEGSVILAAAQAINFIGAGVTAVDAGSGVVNVTISGGGGGSALTIQDEGVSLSTAATKINFVGAGVTVTEPVADEITVTIPGGGGGSALTVQDEGVSLSTAATKLNFVGTGVAVTEPVTDEMLITIQAVDTYDFVVFAGLTLFDNETFYAMKAVRAFLLPTNMAGSYADALTASTGTAVISMRKNGTQFGTITYTASTTGVISSTLTSFAIGDVLTFVGPLTADVTLAGVNITIRGGFV